MVLALPCSLTAPLNFLQRNLLGTLVSLSPPPRFFCSKYSFSLINLVALPTTLDSPLKYELFRSDSFMLFKSANWDEGLSFDDSWIRYFFVLHKKPANLNLRFKLKAFFSPSFLFFPLLFFGEFYLLIIQPAGLSLIDFNAQEALLTFNTPTGEFALAVSYFRHTKKENKTKKKKLDLQRYASQLYALQRQRK